jgi:hypothetical protein
MPHYYWPNKGPHLFTFQPIFNIYRSIQLNKFMIASKRLKISSWGSNRGVFEKVDSLMACQLFNRCLLAACRSIYSDKWKTRKHQICFKLQCKRATGEFSSNNTPNNNFSTGWPISEKSIPIDSAQKVDKNETLKIFKFYSREQLGSFRRALPRE